MTCHENAHTLKREVLLKNRQKSPQKRKQMILFDVGRGSRDRKTKSHTALLMLLLLLLVLLDMLQVSS